MKIGVPKIRLSRKLLLITLGITVLLGGTGAAALYMGGKDMLMGKVEPNVSGGECLDVQTMVVKTPDNHLWLRKFIRMENAPGPERVRTAMRIAGLLAKNNAVDLIHVSVLDTHGPTKRSDMRARAIGAEVLIALKPANLPEMKTPAMANYYEGPVSDEGRFYGDKVTVDFEELGGMMKAMRAVTEKPDCTKPEAPAGETAAKPADHGKKDDTAKSEGPKKEEHGAAPAKEGEAAEEHGEAPKKEEGMLDSMLGMVGLGGSEEKPAEGHETKADDAGAQTEAHGKEPTATDEKAAEAHPAKPAEEKGMFDSMLDMVGMGASEEKPAETHESKAEPAHEAVAEDPAAESHGDTPAAAEEQATPVKAKAHAPEDAKAAADAKGHDEVEAAPAEDFVLPGEATESHDKPKPADEKHAEATPASPDEVPAEAPEH